MGRQQHVTLKQEVNQFVIDSADFGMYNCVSCGFVKIRLNVFSDSPCGRCGGVVESGCQQVNKTLGVNDVSTRSPEGPYSAG